AGEFTLVDTAGIRREAHFDDDPEFYATMRALNALERAEVAGLVVDASQGFHQQEARLAHEALEAGCSLMLLYNKWDLVTERDADRAGPARDHAVRERALANLRELPALRVVGVHRSLRLPRRAGAAAGAEESVMAPLAAVLATLAVGYLSGSLPWGLWLGRWFRGVDVRSLGSGNLGATNVYRALGPALGITTLALDMLKGAIPVWLVTALPLGARFPGGSEGCRLAGGFAAIAGHVWTMFAGFRGGKGGATTAGLLLALSPIAFLAFGI